MVVARIIDEAKLLTFCFGHDKKDNTEYQNIDIISLSIAYFLIPQVTIHFDRCQNAIRSARIASLWFSFGLGSNSLLTGNSLSQRTKFPSLPLVTLVTINFRAMTS